MDKALPLYYHRVSYVETFGTSYSKGNVVFCDIVDDIPMFGKIKEIVVLPSNDYLFVLTPYIGKYFNAHFNSYELYPTDCGCILYAQKELADHRILSINKSFSTSPYLSHKSFVCLKYHVFV